MQTQGKGFSRQEQLTEQFWSQKLNGRVKWEAEMRKSFLAHIFAKNVSIRIKTRPRRRPTFHAACFNHAAAKMRTSRDKPVDNVPAIALRCVV